MAHSRSILSVDAAPGQTLDGPDVPGHDQDQLQSDFPAFSRVMASLQGRSPRQIG
jgi:hypothetical protein